MTDHDRGSEPGTDRASAVGPHLAGDRPAHHVEGLPVDADVTPSDRLLAEPVPPPPARSGSVAPRTPPRGRARARYLSQRTRNVIVHRWDILAVIAGGGALGSLARWQLSQRLPHPAGTFPWATFDTNVSGCLLIGVLMVFVTEVWPPSRYARPFLGVGVLGGFTTFSTYMLDARGLLVAGRTATAGAYVFGSLAAGLAAVWAGLTLARLAVRNAERRRLRRLRRLALRRHADGPSASTIPTSTTRSER